MTTPEQHHEHPDPVASQVNEAFADSGTLDAILDNSDRLFANYPDVTQEEIDAHKAMIGGAQAALKNRPADQPVRTTIEADAPRKRLDLRHLAVNPDNHGPAREDKIYPASPPKPPLGRFIRAPLFEIKPPDQPKDKES